VKPKKSALIFLLAAATALAVPESTAQMGGGGYPGGARGGPGNMSREKRAPQPGRGADQFELVLEEFREDLHLAPEQQGAWDRYVDKLRAMATDMGRERTQMQSEMQSDALQQIDRRVDFARDRLTALEDIAYAARALYNTLTPEQKKVADSRLARVLPQGFGSAPMTTTEKSGRQRP
jgi:LTXXQ motif family protein